MLFQDSVINAIKKLEDYQGDRSQLIKMIDEYNSLVHKRSKFNASYDSSATFAVETVLSRFSEDAVNTTYGMVWNALDKPFSIIDKTDLSLRFDDLENLLWNHLESKNSGFKTALRHALKCYLEYGSAWMYILPAKEKTEGLRHRVFSLKEIKRKLDIYLEPEQIYLDRGQNAYTFCERKETKWKIHQKNDGDFLKESAEIDYCPILELSQTGIYSDIYPCGYGLKALADLKRYDNIVKKLTEVAGEAINPTYYTTSAINIANKSNIGYPIEYGSRKNPLIVDDIMGARQPFGNIPHNVATADAWRIFEITSVSLRESFNFINRLLTIKDDAQMTATEAQIRSRSDLSQVRDTIETIFSWLNEVHKVQLYIMREQNLLDNFKNVKIENLMFLHTSIFKQEDEQKKIQQINTGLDLTAKLTQVVQILNQSGMQTLDTQAMINKISEMTELALSREQTPNALLSLLGAFSNGSNGQNQ